MKNASQSYVVEVLSLQGVAPDPDAPKAMSALLSVQLAAAEPAYDRLPLEAEPAAFQRALERERGQ